MGKSVCTKLACGELGGEKNAGMIVQTELLLEKHLKLGFNSP